MDTMMVGSRVEVRSGPTPWVVFRRVSEGPDARTVVLTPMQKRVLDQLVLDGPTDGMIARRLGVRHQTVKTHMKTMCRRMGVQGRTAVVCEVLSGRVRVEVQKYSPRRRRDDGDDVDH